MIKFFRQLRQNHLESGKSSKYLKYAIGEILLVVIGILIALQINNWNEGRKNRIEEHALLSQLQSEFQSNLLQLDEKVNIRNTMITSTLKLLSYTDNTTTASQDSILIFLTPTILNPTFDPIVNDINSSGRIQLLKNTRLKELLSRWTSEIVAVKEEEVRWSEYLEHHYVPFLLEHYSIRNILDSYWKNNTMEYFHLDKGEKVRFKLNRSAHHSGESKILQKPNLEDHLAFCATMAKIANTQSESLRKRIVEILELIEKDLQ